MIEVRDEPPGTPAARRLWDEYQELVRERLGPGFVSSQDIFAAEADFRGADAAWIVLYDHGRPVGCGGLRPLGDGVAEIKRMFVSAGARGRGHGRRLLTELESRARARGMRRVRLLTTEVLAEARALYAGAGYRVASAFMVDGRRDYWLEREL